MTSPAGRPPAHPLELISSGSASDDAAAHSDAEVAAAALRCAVEPIRVPGSVQPHGLVLGVDPVTGLVLLASAGAGAVLGTDVHGRRLADVLPGAVEVVDLLVRPGAERTAGASGLEVSAGGGAPVVRLDVVGHLSEGLVLLELEPSDEAAAWGAGTAAVDPGWPLQLPPVLTRLQDAVSVQHLVEALVTGVRGLTGFDRVMAYRFDEDWNGEVIAEDAHPRLDPFLGLHYPASDIPAQARALYARQWLRIIPDIRYTPVPLEPAAHPLHGGPVDLSQSTLRSVSPVHLEYLANMGVAASMSISLMAGDRLWGLVACHHYAGPHRPTQPVRAAAEFLGRTASLLLPAKIGVEAFGAVLAGAEVRAELTERLAARPDSAIDVLTREAVSLADLVPCGGAAVRLHGELRLVGVTPTAERVERLAARIGDRTLVTSALGQDLRAVVGAAGSGAEAGADADEAAALVADASGVLSVPVAGGRSDDVVMWFRPEARREVSWGGAPDSAEQLRVRDGVLTMGPRRSFAAWTELVRGRSTPWAPHEVETATGFARHLTDSMLRQVERTNRLATALQQTLLLAELPDLPRLEAAAGYSPYRDDVVGGDWYDLVPLPSGRVGVVLGDVAGHGLGVASVSSQMRNALRAYLLVGEDPAAALGRLNDQVGSLMPGELATAVVAVVDTTSGELRVASAGHPPVVRLRGEDLLLVDDSSRGPALGLVEGVEYVAHVEQLEPQDLLVLYSDGLVEDRNSSWEERLEALTTELRRARGSLPALCDQLIARVSARADDTTVMALRWVP